MIKAVIFDADGIVVLREKVFSERFSNDFKIPIDKITPFFKENFKLCLIGKSDLKKELEKYIEDWNWHKSINELLDYWFKNESNLDLRIIDSITKLRKNRIKCYLSTNNEKYRTAYLSEKLKLRNYFDKIFSSAYIGVKKPDLNFWELIHKQININKNEVIVWDDDKENADSAKEFGFQAELYTNFNEYSKKMKELINN